MTAPSGPVGADPRGPAPDVAGAGRFLSVEGIDASGKSTLAAALAGWLAARGRPALLLDRHGAVAAAEGYPAEHLAGLRRLIWEYPPQARTSQLGFAHWANLLAAWYHAVDEVVVRPAVAAGTWVVADSWFYKFAARFAVTVGPDAAQRAFVGVTAPDPVLWLDVAPQVCAGRRDTMRPTERGEWQGLDRRPAPTNGPDPGFLTYQAHVRGAYARLAAEHGWLVFTDLAPPDPHGPLPEPLRGLLAVPAVAVAAAGGPAPAQPERGNR